MGAANGGAEQMEQDWLADVRKYAPDADETLVAGIVRYCGIALRSRDASLVSFSDAKETGRVRENFLKKKLALTHDDATLDAAIAAVGERMQADRTKNRVTVYYLLAEHFGLLALFAPKPKASKARAAKAAADTSGADMAVGAGAAAAGGVALAAIEAGDDTSAGPADTGTAVTATAEAPDAASDETSGTEPLAAAAVDPVTAPAVDMGSAGAAAALAATAMVAADGAAATTDTDTDTDTAGAVVAAEAVTPASADSAVDPGSAAATAAAVSAPVMAMAATGSSAAPAHGAPAHSARGRSGGDDDGFLGWAFVVAAVVIGAIILAALLSTLASRSDAPPEAAAPAAPPAAAPAAPATPVVPAEPAAPPAPEGAGVVAIERDAKPVLKVYFDTGKANVTPDFAASAAAVLAYLEANPNAKLAISGYNDPTGNAAANAELSKNRAQNVKAAIEALGVAPERALLEKPAESTSTGVSNAEARRVEVVIRE